MGYTVQTWTDGVSAASAARLTHMEDGIFAAVPKDLVDATGDLLVGSAADTVVRLARGSALQVLRVNAGGTNLEYATPVAATSYRKTTAKTVNTTVAATDLLNAEITIGAGVIGATGAVHLTAWGDWLQNSGGSVAPPRFQVQLGGTTIIDTAAAGAVVAGATRYDWNLDLMILNATAASQTVRLRGEISSGANTVANTAFATGTGFYQEIIAGVNLFHGVNSGLTVDTSTSKTLVLNVINGSASATYETKLFQALVQII